MASIQETQQALQQRQSQISQQKELVSKYESSIPKTTEQQLRGQIGRGQQINPLKAQQQRRVYQQAKEKVGQAKEQLGQYEKDIQEYSKQFSEYLQTDSGKMQYVKEMGIQGQPIYGKLAKGYVTSIMGYKYSTPYGEVTDWSPKERALQMEAKVQAHLTPQEAQQYFKPEIESALTKSGISFQRDSGGQLILQNVPEAMTEISFNTLFGKQTLSFQPTSLGEKVATDTTLKDVRDLAKDEKTQVTITDKAPSVWGGEMFPVVSAQPQTLNTSNALIKDGTTIVLPRNVSGVGSSSQPRDSSSNWFSRIFGSSKDYDKGFKEVTQKEIYSPQLGGFVQASSPNGEFLSQTAIVRMPSIEEAKAIERASYLGSWSGIKTEVPAFVNRQFAKIQEIPFIKNIRESEFMTKAREWKLPEPKQNPNQEWLSPGGVKKGFDWLAEGTLRLGEMSSMGTKDLLNRAGVNTSNSILFKPSPISRETAKNIISSAYMFSAFEPLMRTGTAQQLESEYTEVYDSTTGQMKFIKKADMTRLQATGEFSRLSVNKQLDIIKKAFEGRVYLDKPSIATDLLRAMTFMKESGLTNKQISNILKQIPQVKPFLESTTSTVVQGISEGTALGSSALASTSKGITGKAVQSEMFPLVSSAEMRGISAVETGVSSLNPSKVGETIWSSPSSFSTPLQDKLTKTSVNMFGSLKLNQQIKQKIETKQEPLLRSFTAQIPRLNLKTNQATRQVPRLETRQRLQDPLLFKPRIGTPTRPSLTKPKDPFKIRLPSSDRQKKRTTTKVIPTKGERYLAITKRRGKEVVLGEFRTPQQAEQVAKRTVLGTLAATAKVKTKSGKQIQLSEDKIFRKSLVDPLTIVQRQRGQGRIFSLGEKREIKSSRRRPFKI